MEKHQSSSSGHMVSHNKEEEVLTMGFDQKAMKLVGKHVEVKMYNGLIISGTMSHVNKGYVCFIMQPQEEQPKKTAIRRLAIRDITSMVEV